MGSNLFDQYSYLHFAVGIVIYFFDITLVQWFILHVIFEIVENTQIGIDVINTYLLFWPGGKPQPDSLLNSTGDTIAALIGWVSAYYVDNIIKKHQPLY